ncbi:MAG: TcfC E-set like domain-containing protein, partial [Pseudomonadota bacterium]
MRAAARSVWVLLVAGCLWTLSAQAQDLFVTSDAPPAGFEDLVGPQVTFLDVVYDGRTILSTEATYTTDWLRFADPHAVVTAIDDLAAPKAVAAALDGELATNADQVCYHTAQEDCGSLSPDVAAVIFDESTFRVFVFVHPDLRRVHALSSERYLPPPSASDLATVHQLNVALSDAGFDFGGTSLISRGADRVVGRYESAGNTIGVSELMWQRDARGQRYEAGLFRSLGRNARFVGEHNVAGVRVGTALDLRADLEAREGTPIFLFLNQRSRVDVFRGARLIDSGFYEAGNRQLDTTRLPDGAYEINVQITGNDGRQRRESFFFVRSGRVPPLGETVRYAELGQIVAAPNPASGILSSGGWVRAGLARRMSNAWSVDAETLAAGDDLLGQAGVFGFGRNWQMRASAMLGRGGAAGYWLQMRAVQPTWSAGLDLRVINARDTADAAESLFAQSLRQSALTLNVPWRRGRLTLRGQLDQNGSDERTWSWGGALSIPLRQTGPLALELESDVLL